MKKATVRPWIMMAMVWFAMGQTGWGAYLTNNISLNGGAVLRMNAQANGGGSDQSVKRKSDSWWYFADKNGDDPGEDPVTPAGLDMQGYKLFTTPSKGVAGTHIHLNLNGGSITNGTGNSFETFTSTIKNANTGNVTISNVYDVVIGAVLTYNSNSEWGTKTRKAGNVIIGSEAAPARNVKTGEINALAGRIATAGDVNIYATNTVETGSISTHGIARYSLAKSVTIGSSSVRSASITVTGNIYTYQTYQDADKPGGAHEVTLFSRGNVSVTREITTRNEMMSSRRYGNVTINHDGALSVGGNITTMHLHTFEQTGKFTPHYAGNVTLNGDGLNDGPSGECVVQDIDSRYDQNGIIRVKAPAYAGNIEISGYTNVTVRNLNGSINHYFGTFAQVAGNVTITNISGNVNITGSIDLDASKGDAYDGILTISCGGRITLASLDLTKVRYAKLTAGGGESYITGAITGFDPGNTTLRCDAGQTIYYYAGQQTDNDLKHGQSYRLKNLDGTADGGWLKSILPSGAMYLIR